jgi:hypothetical protein
MHTDKPSFEPLVLPPDEIGWSDESFELATRYVMNTATLAEITDMDFWLQDNIVNDMPWSLGPSIPRSGIFKRTILYRFKVFSPSVMQNAYNEIKQNPRPRLKARNVLYISINVIIVLFIGTLVISLIASILSNS